MGDDVEPTIDRKVLSELKVVELKEELGKMGLSKLGNKSVLYDRLKEHLLRVAMVSAEIEQVSLVKAVEGEGDRNKSMAGEESEDAHGDFENASEKDPQSEIKHENHQDHELEEKDESGEEEKLEESGDDEEKFGEEKLEKSGEEENLEFKNEEEMKEDSEEEMNKDEKKLDRNVTNASSASFITCDSDLAHHEDSKELTEELDYEETTQHHHTSVHIKEEKKVKAEKLERPTPVKKEYAAERKIKREHTISPALYPVNQVLMIGQLRRPFTPKQLMELLETFGTVVDNGFWMDRIKSMCLVKFSTVEEAIAARGGLHNIVWPSHSPSTLEVDYSDDEGLLRYMRSEEKPEPNTSTGSQPAGTSSLGVSVSLLNREQHLVQGSSTTTSQGLAAHKDKECEHARDVKRAHSPTPPYRESETGSSEKRRREERHDHSKRGHSPIARWVQEPEIPTKTADELFKKTTTLPAVYYVALTEDQILERSKRKATEAQMLAEKRAALQNARREKGERGDNNDKDKPKTSTKKADDGLSTVRSRSPRNAKDARNTQRGCSQQTVSSRYNRR